MQTLELTQDFMIFIDELFPQAVGLYYKDETNTKTIVIKKDNCFIAPLDGWKGYERKYHQIKKKGICFVELVK